MRYFGVLRVNFAGALPESMEELLIGLSREFNEETLGFNVVIIPIRSNDDQSDFRIYELHDEDGEEISEATLAKIRAKFEEKFCEQK